MLGTFDQHPSKGKGQKAKGKSDLPEAISQPPRVLITDDCHPQLIEKLEGRGFAVDFEPDITPEDTTRRIADYTGLIINSKIRVDQTFLKKAEKLQFVGRLAAGWRSWIGQPPPRRA